MISFVHSGPIHAKGRPRFTTQNGRPVVYTPAQTRQYERSLKHAAHIASIGHEKHLGPVVVTVEAVLAVPASYTKAKRQRALDGLLWPPRLDVDNVAKTVLDALKGIVWLDDKQVVELHATKRYGPEPYLRVEVKPWGGST